MIRKIFITIIGLFIIITASIAVLYFQKPDFTYLNLVQRYAARKVAERFDKTINKMPKDKRTIVDYDTLMNSLDPIERDFASRIFDIDPKKLGFKGPFYSMNKPYDLIEIPSVEEGNRQTCIQYCPKHSYKDYLKMTAQMQKDIGKKLYIDSGYRSPGRQAYLFFHYLTTSSKYSLKENAKRIAMPGYSEHGSPTDNAVDFCTKDGIGDLSGRQSANDFTKLPEYKWMLKNAAKYNFYLSYPENNKWGVAFKPWHWHWEKK